jgi:hypothetical protein
MNTAPLYGSNYLNFKIKNIYMLVPMAARSEARTVFGRWNTWDRGFGSLSGHGCVFAFFFVVVSYVGKGLASG